MFPMGLNLEELRPVTPIRVAAISTRPSSNLTIAEELKELNSSIRTSNRELKELNFDDDDDDDDEECRTPKSEDQILRPPSVCPPAPRKPPAAKRKAGGGLSPREFFQVPYDLASIFVVLPPSSKKMKSN